MSGLMFGMLPDESTFKSVRIDSDVGGLIITPHIHHEVHEGEMFSASYIVPHGSEIANDAAQDFLLITAAKLAHSSFAFTVGGDCEMQMYEGTTTSANGTGLAEINMNRSSSNTATVTMFHTPTVTVVGTLLHTMFIPGGAGPTASGMMVKQDTEWLLKTATKYLFRVTNRSGNAIQLSGMFEWYEETV